MMLHSVSLSVTTVELSSLLFNGLDPEVNIKHWTSKEIKKAQFKIGPKPILEQGPTPSVVSTKP